MLAEISAEIMHTLLKTQEPESQLLVVCQFPDIIKPHTGKQSMPVFHKSRSVTHIQNLSIMAITRLQSASQAIG